MTQLHRIPVLVALLLLNSCQYVAAYITGFTLMDALLNRELQPLQNGDILNLNDLKTHYLTIRADPEASNGTAVLPIELNLDDEVVLSVNTAPYLLGGYDIEPDGDFDYLPVSQMTTIGTHTLQAITYDDDNNEQFLSITFTVTNDVAPYNTAQQGALTGELKLWHKLTLAFLGPNVTETSEDINPFLDYRLDVRFQHVNTATTYIVPGYYAADGNAANTGAEDGNVWLVHFTPDSIGEWTWEATFVKGINVAVEFTTGISIEPGLFDGESGSFSISANDDIVSPDLRARGRLEYTGETHYLQFAGDQSYYVKVGTASPENLLAYADFDNTPNITYSRARYLYLNKESTLKTYAPHVGDYVVGNPTWAGGKGTGLVGAINYLASTGGVNAISFLTMGLRGDDESIFPFYSSETSEADGGLRVRYDVSKLAQWEIVFKHAEEYGMLLHFKTQEQENDQLLDGGELGIERKLYYRELMARFGHHLAIIWDLGEENTNSFQQRQAYSDFFKSIDPYNHPVVIHAFSSGKDAAYGSLLGYPNFDGASLQSNPRKNEVFTDTLQWVDASEEAGHRWIVTNDEQNPGRIGVLPDAIDPNHDLIRQNALWANIMAGGSGIEYFFGYGYDESDLTLQDFRSRANLWDQSRHALELLGGVPFWKMSNANQLLRLNKIFAAYCLAETNRNTIIAYLKDARQSISGINLESLPGEVTMSVQWYNPRVGGSFVNGSIVSVAGGNPTTNFGFPPNTPNKDWIVVLDCISGCELLDAVASDVPTDVETEVEATDVPSATVVTMPPTKRIESSSATPTIDEFDNLLPPILPQPTPSPTADDFDILLPPVIDDQTPPPSTMTPTDAFMLLPKPPSVDDGEDFGDGGFLPLVNAEGSNR